jgi:hypothetical protein
MNYYTVLSDHDGLLIGTVYNSQTNQEVHKTKPYASPSHITKEVNKFLASISKQEASTENNNDRVVTNTLQTTASTPVRHGQHKCCGR